MEANRCQICNQDEQWHKEHRPRHEFSPDSTVFRTRDDTRQDQRKLPADPVLRMALIKKGIISADDLADVEKELKSAGFAVAEPRGGREDTVTRTRKGSKGGVRSHTTRPKGS